MLTGTYIGNGAIGRTIFTGAPANLKALVICPDIAATSANMYSGTPAGNVIVAFSAADFTIGPAYTATWNLAGQPYRYGVWTVAESNVAVGTYIGDGTPLQTIASGLAVPIKGLLICTDGITPPFGLYIGAPGEAAEIAIAGSNFDAKGVINALLQAYRFVAFG